MQHFFPMFVMMAVVLLIVVTELIKRLDRKDRMKGYRVWIPAGLSGGIAWLLRIGNFFSPPEQVWFWWAAIFAFSVFAYEAVLKKVTAALGLDQPDAGVTF